MFQNSKIICNLCFLYPVQVLVIAVLISVIVYLLKQKRKAKALNVSHNRIFSFFPFLFFVIVYTVHINFMNFKLKMIIFF